MCLQCEINDALASGETCLLLVTFADDSCTLVRGRPTERDHVLSSVSELVLEKSNVPVVSVSQFTNGDWIKNDNWRKLAH